MDNAIKVLFVLYLIMIILMGAVVVQLARVKGMVYKVQDSCQTSKIYKDLYGMCEAKYQYGADGEWDKATLLKERMDKTEWLVNQLQSI